MLRLNNLDAFREMYGFVSSDDVLRAISLMIGNTARELGSPEDFIGQVSQNDFIIITQQNNLKPLMKRLQMRIDQAIDYFYPLKDRGRKEILGKRLGIALRVVDPSVTSLQSLEAL